MTDREIVKQFVSERWSDQKIAEVFAFNEDGKMEHMSGCCCLIGVYTSPVLHHRDPFSFDQRCPNPMHYTQAKRMDCGLWDIEKAYMHLCGNGQAEGNRVFGEILREVMAEREQQQAQSNVDSEEKQMESGSGILQAV